LMLTGSGGAERVVSVLALQIEASEDQIEDNFEKRSLLTSHSLHVKQKYILAQIAKWEGGEIKPSCTLPGFKMARGELPGEATQRLISSRLAACVGNVRITKVERETKWKDSSKYGVMTKYLRNVCSAEMDVPLNAKICSVKSADHMSFLMTSQLTSVSIRAKQSNQRAGSFYATEWKHREDPDLPDSNVYVIPSGPDTATFYAWLSSGDFKSLSAPEGEKDLVAWVSRLEYDGTAVSDGENNANEQQQALDDCTETQSSQESHSI